MTNTSNRLRQLTGCQKCSFCDFSGINKLNCIHPWRNLTVVVMSCFFYLRFFALLAVAVRFRRSPRTSQTSKPQAHTAFRIDYVIMWEAHCETAADVLFRFTDTNAIPAGQSQWLVQHSSVSILAPLRITVLTKSFIPNISPDWATSTNLLQHVCHAEPSLTTLDF